MIILIDAYNLLKQLYATDYIADQERDAYITLLNRYNKLKRHKIILMFDGGFFDMPTRQKEEQVMIVYAGRNQTADQAIKDYLKLNHSKDLLLVTADRELINYAHKFDVVAINPLVFDGYVKQAITKPSERVKEAVSQLTKMNTDQENEELDQLMEQASLHLMQKPEEDDVRNTALKRGNNSVLSKKDRKIMSKLSKL